MKALIIILVIVAIGGLVGLYYLGKDVKKKEKVFEDMFKERVAKQNLNKYKRKSTPKVPANTKAKYKRESSIKYTRKSKK